LGITILALTVTQFAARALASRPARAATGSAFPTQGWLARQITEAFPWDTAPRFLLRDRDASYGQTFRDRVRAMAIEEVITAPRSPWQNAYVERIIGSIRRECLDHVIILDERHLCRVLSAYFDLSPPKQDTSLARQGMSGTPAHTATLHRHRCRLPTGRRSAPSLRASRSVNCCR
jgi:transposase InsO family protein